MNSSWKFIRTQIDSNLIEKYFFWLCCFAFTVLLAVGLLHAPVVSAGESVNIGSKNTVKITGKINLFVCGDWKNNGNFLSPEGAVIFNGKGDQSISGNADVVFFNLIIDKPSGLLKLQNPLIVTHLLIVKKGRIDNSSQTIILQPGTRWQLPDAAIQTAKDKITIDEIVDFSKYLTHNKQFTKAVQSDLNADAISAAIIPERFALYTNFPNPFNQRTTIQFDLPIIESTMLQVKIIIYDITGRSIKTIADKEFLPGSYTIVWDGKNDHGMEVTSGVYIYRLVSDKIFCESKKMMLIR